MAGSTLKQLHIFADLCGGGGLPHVVLMTTMWSTVRQDVGKQREDQLKSHNDLWAPVLNLGATTSRFDNSYDSAWEIVKTLEEKRGHRIKVQLPKEMVDDKLELKETRSAKTLHEELKKLVDAEEAANRKLRDMVTQHGDNDLVVSSLNKQRDDIRNKIEELKVEMKRLNIPILRRFRKLFQKSTVSPMNRSSSHGSLKVLIGPCL
jgi:molybdenum-dependent DNA-binding transcriptional regulator ModE